MIHFTEVKSHDEFYTQQKLLLKRKMFQTQQIEDLSHTDQHLMGINGVVYSGTRTLLLALRRLSKGLRV